MFLRLVNDCDEHPTRKLGVECGRRRLFHETFRLFPLGSHLRPGRSPPDIAYRCSRESDEIVLRDGVINVLEWQVHINHPCALLLPPCVRVENFSIWSASIEP